MCVTVLVISVLFSSTAILYFALFGSQLWAGRAQDMEFVLLSDLSRDGLLLKTVSIAYIWLLIFMHFLLSYKSLEWCIYKKNSFCFVLIHLLKKEKKERMVLKSEFNTPTYMMILWFLISGIWCLQCRKFLLILG